ncbi:hypothetical protein [Sinomonas susongensis]|uniref:hypothetical protein n=1 Tax=Sinomonas susongensis TaxID=1324851 RepID=UPI001108E320|nr:hypothetical protein [Sinomonas susongensis]
MSRARRDRVWPRPRTTRHAWFKDSPEPGEPPRQVLVVAWRRHSYQWSALIIYCVDVQGSPDPVVVQRWVPAHQLRPVRADPNQAFGLR